MKRETITISLEAQCGNCAYSYMDNDCDVFSCSKTKPHKEVLEDDYCDSWKILEDDNFECLGWSNVKLVAPSTEKRKERKINTDNLEVCEAYMGGVDDVAGD